MNMERFGPSAMWSYVTLGWALRYIIIATTVVMLHYTCFFHSYSYFVFCFFCNFLILFCLFLLSCCVMMVPPNCHNWWAIAPITSPLFAASPSLHNSFFSVFSFLLLFQQSIYKILVIKIVYYRENYKSCEEAVFVHPSMSSLCITKPKPMVYEPVFS